MADREKLMKLLCDTLEDGCVGHCNYPYCFRVKNTADHLISHGVTVRERGRWKPHCETFDEDAAVGILGGTYQTGWQCSVCGRYELRKEPYCNCGADMRGEEDA